jgi:Holliday junction DNA helicase RuvB
LGATLRFLYNTKEKTHVFIDEIHQLSMQQQELFFPILDNHKVTIIGATTDTGRLVEPFQNRFRLRLTIQRYSEKDCYEIADWYCKKKKIIAAPTAVKRIAEYGRHTPRVIFSLVEACYNKARFMAISSSKITGGDKDRMTVLTDSIAAMTFGDLELYAHGIEKQEVAVLRALKNHGHVSLTTLCAITRIDQAQYMHFYEPHLLGLDFITKSSRGRSLTKEGEKFLATVPEPK